MLLVKNRVHLSAVMTGLPRSKTHATYLCRIDSMQLVTASSLTSPQRRAEGPTWKLIESIFASFFHSE